MLSRAVPGVARVASYAGGVVAVDAGMGEVVQDDVADAWSAGWDLVVHDGPGTAVLRGGWPRSRGAGPGVGTHDEAPVGDAGLGGLALLIAATRRVSARSRTRPRL
jgi:hypothetical protein